jgi:tetratricopeptide (TPR) repeat protein
MSSKAFLLLGLVALFLSGARVAATEDANPTDLEISYWERRLEKDSADYVAPQKLGEAYTQKSRETGDFSYLSKAEVVLKKSLAIKPKYTPAMNSLAYVCCMQHRFTEAITLCEQTLKLAADDAFSFGILGDAWMEKGDLEKCEANYVKAMELAPGMFSYARWANLQFMRGSIPETITFYKQALEDAQRKTRAAPHVAWCQVQLGYTYFRIGKLDKAEEYYKAALETFPSGNLALEYMAELRGAQDKFDEAAALYEKAIAIAPRPETYQALGDLYTFANQPEKAAPMIANAEKLYIESVNKGNIHYYHHLATLYSDSRKLPDEALRWAQRDLGVRQGVYAQDCLAWALYNKGQFAEAAEAMKKALASGTRDSHLYYHASLIFFRSGDMAASRDNGKKAAEVNPLYVKFHAHR